MENGLDGMHLFDCDIIKNIDWEEAKADFKDGVSLHNPGHNLLLRPLSICDYDCGYMKLLSELTSIGEVSQEQFAERFMEMRRCAGTYYVVVLQDTMTSQIIGSATLVLEQKFIHDAGQRGRIEDVVVSKEYRGKQLGKLLVQVLTLMGKELGCYKLSLECADERIRFYESFGYKKDGQHFMVQRFKD